jgi:hypothetical protein
MFGPDGRDLGWDNRVGTELPGHDFFRKPTSKG